MRERDFTEVQHYGGVSPSWPISYADLEPHYAEAERLYLVHGRAGEDPTEPWRSSPFPHPPVSHEPRIQSTVRFGTDPATSALDIDCRAHDVDNLYVVDTRCFPSSAAVNPALTAMANALRVGEHLLERLGVEADAALLPEDNAKPVEVL